MNITDTECKACGKAVVDVVVETDDQGLMWCTCGEELAQAPKPTKTVKERIAELHRTMDRLEATLSSIVELTGGEPFGSCETCDVAEKMGEISWGDRAILCEGCEHFKG